MIYGGEARREQIAEILMSCPDLWHKENALSAADKVLAALPASPLRGREVSLTDDALNAALSEYYDMSPRGGWSEAQRVGMRKAILTVLSALPSKQPAAEDK